MATAKKSACRAPAARKPNSRSVYLSYTDANGAHGGRWITGGVPEAKTAAKRLIERGAQAAAVYVGHDPEPRHVFHPKANTAPRRTKVAASRRSIALRTGRTGRTPVAVVAQRLATMSPPKKKTKDNGLLNTGVAGFTGRDIKSIRATAIRLSSADDPETIVTSKGYVEVSRSGNDAIVSAHGRRVAISLTNKGFEKPRRS